MQECPKCQSAEIRKDGIVKQKQRFRCKICNYRFTVQQIGKPVSKRREAFILYLAGLDYNSSLSFQQAILPSHKASR